MIVADTNLVAYFVIPGAATQMSEAVRSKDRNWIAPALLRYELINVAAQHVLRKLLDRDDALKAYRRGLKLVQVSDEVSDPLEILNLCQSSGCSAYDLEFVALAMRMAVPLVTSDKEVLESFPALAVHPASFMNQQ